MNVAAIVTWYNPEQRFVENIRSYSAHVMKVIIVDNSTDNNSTLLENEYRTEYLFVGRNVGVAAALNIGYRRAMELGMEWVLTMDQDSAFQDQDIRAYLNPSAEHFKQSRVAVFGPRFYGSSDSHMTECNSVISSGALVNLSAHKISGGYNEKLFIDQVDHEYCIRLKKLGFRILRIGYIWMRHEIGSPITKKRFGKLFTTFNHDAIRRYYITRNTLYMRRYHRMRDVRYLRMLLMDVVNIVAIEDNKLKKLRFMVMGFTDYLKGRMGPLNLQ